MTTQTPIIITTITNPTNNQVVSFPNNNLTSTSPDKITDALILINTPILQIYFLKTNPNQHFIHIPNPADYFHFIQQFTMSPRFNLSSTQSLISKSLTKIRNIYQNNPTSPALLSTIQSTIAYFYSNQSILIHLLHKHQTSPIQYILSSYKLTKNSNKTQTNTNLTALISSITLPTD